MEKTVAVSFEEDIVKVVHASFKGNTISIDKAEIIADDQLDNYLRREKSKKFIVTYNFNESYHNVVTVPVAGVRHLEKIVESEIKKTVEIKDFSFIYTPVGERVIGNKRVTELAYFAVNNEELRNVVKRFYDNGKMVKAVYPKVFSVAPLFEFRDEAVIGVLGAKTEKTAFLIKKGIIYFIRKFSSLTTNISDIDIQDINMTANYCLQNIRINPSLVIFLGNLLESSSINIPTTVPLAALHKPEYIRCDRKTFNDFILPITSFYASKSSNILNKEFKDIYMLKNYLLNASRVFVILAFLCLGIAFYNVKNISDMKGTLKLIKANNADIENIFSEYTAKETQLRQYMSTINFLNKDVPEVQKLLIALTEINMKNSKIESIETAVKDDSISVTINGTIHADTYTSIQTGFQDIIDSLDKIKDIRISDKTMDIDRKTFLIKLDYKN